MHFPSLGSSKDDCHFQEKDAYQPKLRLIDEETDKAASEIGESTHAATQQKKGKAKSYSDLDGSSSK